MAAGARRADWDRPPRILPGLGAGSLSLVAGGLTIRRNLAAPTLGVPSGSFDKVTLTLAPPIPSLSPAGLATRAALVLLAAGWVLRRRFCP